MDRVSYGGGRCLWLNPICKLSPCIVIRKPPKASSSHSSHFLMRFAMCLPVLPHCAAIGDSQEDKGRPNAWGSGEPPYPHDPPPLPTSHLVKSYWEAERHAGLNEKLLAVDPPIHTCLSSINWNPPSCVSLFLLRLLLLSFSIPYTHLFFPFHSSVGIFWQVCDRGAVQCWNRSLCYLHHSETLVLVLFWHALVVRAGFWLLSHLL